MKITEAIAALQSAHKVLGDDAQLFVSIPGASGETFRRLQFIGPVALKEDPTVQGVTIAVLDNIQGTKGAFP